MKVKICGITTLDDAQAAIEAGADMLGFNFYPASPRYIAPEYCGRMVSALITRVTRHPSPPTLVGVFVNTPAPEVASMMAYCSLDLAQLSGDEPAETLSLLGGRAYKAIQPLTLGLAEEGAGRYTSGACGRPALLVDTPHQRLYGGTGRPGDWSVASHIANVYPILLAGGLTPENVSGAVQKVMPWGVDVASGVESSPGVKDYRKMQAFVHAARGAVAVRKEPLC